MQSKATILGRDFRQQEGHSNVLVCITSIERDEDKVLDKFIIPSIGLDMPIHRLYIPNRPEGDEESKTLTLDQLEARPINKFLT